MKLLSFIVPFAFLCSCKAQAPKFVAAENDNSLLWEITGKDSKPSYLFGTFHLMCKNDISFSENVINTLKAADEIYFEMDLDDLSNTLGALLVMNMKNGKKLEDLYTPEEFQRLENFFRDSLKTPIGMMQRMKPLFLQALLYPKLIQCKNVSGIEQELLMIAKESKKEIKGFETIQFQASVFDSIPYDVQARALLGSIDSVSQYAVEFEEMVKVYKDQDFKKMEALFDKSSFGITYNKEILLDKRNRNWVEQLKKLMPEKSLFIAVGAGHLVGEQGVIELLRKEGYTVRALKNN